MMVRQPDTIENPAEAASSALVRPLLAALLFTLLAGVYMLTYSARIESEDTLYLYDATGSLVRYGDLLLDLSAGVRPPQVFDDTTPYPLDSVNIEPLQVVLAAPLYALADALDGVGLVHGVWLFNVFVTALTGVVFFWYVLALGYQTRIAVAGTLLLGVTTIMLPYSKSFFREPLATLLMLVAGLATHRWRERGYRSLWLMFGAELEFAGALLTKQATVFALPALAVVAVPALSLSVLRQRRVWVAVVALAVMVAALFVLLQLLDSSLSFVNQLNHALDSLLDPEPYLLTAFSTYLLSPGGSVWGTSPVLLLAIPGVWLLLRAGRRRYALVGALMLATFAVGYVLNRGEDWFGGTSWPPRFLVPVVPYLMLLTLPVLERALRKPYRAWTGVVGVLVLYGLWVQLSAVSYWWGDFPALLPPQANGLTEWTPSFYDPRYLRWTIIPAAWGTRQLDSAWVRADALRWGAAFAGLVTVCAALVWWVQAKGVARVRYVVMVLPLVLLALVYGGLRAIYPHDEMYYAYDEGLWAVLPIIEAQTRPGDVVLMSMGHERFFLNYAKIDTTRVVGLRHQYGEPPGEGLAPRVVAENPDEIVANKQEPLVHALAATRERLWLLMDRGEFISWSVRPMERFMAMHYYPLQYIELSPTVRLIEYSTAQAPDPVAFRGVDIPTSLRFGDSIRLLGFNLPEGRTYAAGDALPVSFYWRTDAPLNSDYTVAWFLAAEGGGVVAEAGNWQPNGGFSKTTTWEPGVPVWDNRALRLPENLEPGRYVIWVLLYDFDEEMQPRRLPVRGLETVDGTIGVLPIVIEIVE